MTSVPNERFHALVVGISVYRHLPPLPAGVAEGAQRLADFLTESGGGGYPAEQVTLRLNGAATAEVLREDLQYLSDTEEDATVLVYFAGHGHLFEDGTSCILPVEADPLSLESTTLSGDELFGALSALRAARCIAIFDCCHAGGLSQGLSGDLVKALHRIPGLVVLAAARGGETSSLNNSGAPRSWQADPSLFSKLLLEGLTGGAGRRGRVTPWDLFEYLQPRMAALRSDQHPIFQGKLEEDFPVARSLGGTGEEQGPAGFRHHAYLSCAEEDEDWIRQTVFPRLQAAGLSVAMSLEFGDPAVPWVANAERGILTSRRTVAVFSPAYLHGEMNIFIDAMAQTIGLEDGVARLIPIFRRASDRRTMPLRLRMLVGLELEHPTRGHRNLDRLIDALRSPPDGLSRHFQSPR